MLLARDAKKIAKMIEAEQRIRDEAVAAGVKVKITKPPIDQQKLRVERMIQEVKEQQRRELLAWKQEQDDKKALQNKIKMAKVRKAKRKK